MLSTPTRMFRLLAAATGLSCLATGAGSAQGVADFYRGRNVSLIISSGPGGGYDTYSRTLARHINRHVPGRPGIVTQNMPGAGSLIAINYIYNVAARDGSVLADSDSTMPFYTLFDGQNAKFDPFRLNWLGSIGRQIGICVAWKTSAFKTIDDVLLRPMRVSGTGAQSWRTTMPRLYNLTAGTKFEVITGYGTTEAFLALERSEVDGTCVDYHTLEATRPDWLQDRKVTIIAQYGLEPVRGLEGIPLGLDRVKDTTDRAAMELILSQQLAGRPYLAPPDVPADRLTALRAAFEATMKDQAFRADAEKSRLMIDPMTSEQMEALLRRAYASPPAIVERAKNLLKRAAGK
jgi:tripartite-type tricarboxylate transporter receptor subunit TctC